MIRLAPARSDLPLEGDPTSRFLPWLIAPMVFLCAVAVAGSFILSALIGRWDRDVSGTLTVQIAAPADKAGEAAMPARVEAAIKLLSTTSGIASARALSQDQLVALLAPWLGNGEILKDLPVPALIDVTLEPDARVDLRALDQRLGKAVPGASLDDHRVWLGKLIGLSRGIETLALAIVVLIGGATSTTVIYATRTGMSVHQEVIEVVHMIGATDDYLARQFASRAFALGLKGGLIGFVPTVGAMIALAFGGRAVEGGFIADLSLPWLGWLTIALLPLAAALLAMVTARLTVHASLARLP